MHVYFRQSLSLNFDGHKLQACNSINVTVLLIYLLATAVSETPKYLDDGQWTCDDNENIPNNRPIWVHGLNKL